MGQSLIRVETNAALDKYVQVDGLQTLRVRDDARSTTLDGSGFGQTDTRPSADGILAAVASPPNSVDLLIDNLTNAFGDTAPITKIRQVLIRNASDAPRLMPQATATPMIVKGDFLNALLGATGTPQIKLWPGDALGLSMQGGDNDVSGTTISLVNEAELAQALTASGTVSGGTATGSHTATQARDGVYHQGTVGATPADFAMEYSFPIPSGQVPSLLELRGRFQSAASPGDSTARCVMQIWDEAGNQYVNLSTGATDNTFLDRTDDAEYTWAVTANAIQAGSLWCRIIGEPNDLPDNGDSMFVDFLQVQMDPTDVEYRVYLAGVA